MLTVSEHESELLGLATLTNSLVSKPLPPTGPPPRARRERGRSARHGSRLQEARLLRFDPPGPPGRARRTRPTTGVASRGRVGPGCVFSERKLSGRRHFCGSPPRAANTDASCGCSRLCPSPQSLLELILRELVEASYSDLHTSSSTGRGLTERIPFFQLAADLEAVRGISPPSRRGQRARAIPGSQANSFLRRSFSAAATVSRQPPCHTRTRLQHDKSIAQPARLAATRRGHR